MVSRSLNTQNLTSVSLLFPILTVTLMQVWWCVAVILMLRRWSHEDYEFVTTLGYILSSSHNEIQSKKKNHPG